jgi:small-conductance mechanosensitive channel
VHTQVTVLRKVAMVVIGLFALASALMVFESVRRFGTTILASAGVAGIIVGFAAQRSIATLLAGFQIALTQPIRVDDVVIVEGEWGRIEEITLTYVVVRIWDERRLVLPISYFIEKPFQNWTRNGSNILGTVMLYVDYTVPMEELRAEADRVIQSSPLWDGRVKVVHVTDARERTLEVRVLVSSSDAGRNFELRAFVREKLVGWLQERHPRSLPVLRTEVRELA